VEKKDLAETLKNKEAFRKLPISEIILLAEHALGKQLASGEYLSQQGNVWPYVLYVRDGELRWRMLSSGGKEYQLFKVEPGEIFWAHSLFDDQPMPASLQAVDEVSVFLWSRDQIYPIFKRYPDALWDIPRRLTRIMRRAREIIYGLAFQPVAGRLASYILEHLKEPHQQILEREMTLEDMASALATSPEVVCRLLYQFQADGVIDITRTTITLKDREGLDKLVDLS
jgi:CRP-like cAMP-binding protein